MNKKNEIQRKNGIAIWRQIADAIRADITAGKYKKGEKLPAEIALAEIFKVNRHTVRSAIAALVQEGVVFSDQEVAIELNLVMGAPVVHIETLHYVDGRPISHSSAWFPADRFPNIAIDYEKTSSVTKALLAANVQDYFRYSTTISARHADNNDLSLLNLTPGAIVLTTRAVNVDSDSVPIQYSNTCFAADRMEISINTYSEK